MLFLISGKVWLQRTLFISSFIKSHCLISLCGRHNLTPVSNVWAPGRLNKLPKMCFQFLFKLIGKSTMAFSTEANNGTYAVLMQIFSFKLTVYDILPMAHCVPCTTDGTKLLVTSLCETSPKSLFHIPTCVLGFEYAP